MKKGLIVGFIFLLISQMAWAQEAPLEPTKPSLKAGDVLVAVGGNVTIWPSYLGDTAIDGSFMAGIGYLLTDNFETDLYFVKSETQRMLGEVDLFYFLGQLKYNLSTEGTFIPYLGLQVGTGLYDSYKYTKTMGTCGGLLGLRIFISEKTAFYSEFSGAGYFFPGPNPGGMSFNFGINQKW